MKKIVIHKPGTYSRLKLEEHPNPEPGCGEFRIDVSSIGVNYADCCVRWGIYESAKRYVGWPITPGFEFSGIVSAVGPEAVGFEIGDEVFGVTRFGAYASQICVSQNQIFKKPGTLSFDQAAAFPAVFLTAYHALHQLSIVRKEGRVLIHSAAGGVGSALVQLCNLAGLKTVGVVGSSHKVAFLESLGCGEIIDKSSQDLWPAAERFGPEGYDAIFDANGYETFKESYRHLASTGKLFVYGSHTLLPKKGGRLNYLKAAIGLLRTPKFQPLELMSANKSVVGFNISFLFDRQDLVQEAMKALISWVVEGQIDPPKVTPFKFEDVAKSHQAIESGTTTGKLVLTV